MINTGQINTSPSGISLSRTPPGAAVAEKLAKQIAETSGNSASQRVVLAFALLGGQNEPKTTEEVVG